MDWKKISLANNFLYGLRFRAWVRLLAGNRFAVEPRYWHRALAVTLSSLANSMAFRLQALRPAPPKAPLAKAPLFILGHWRGGTTHLQYLLSRHPEAFAWADTFQVLNPETFTLTRRLFSPLLDLLLPATRPMDAMALSSKTPAEDEFALALTTGLSPYCALAFPRNRGHYARYLSFETAAAAEREAWKAAFGRFVGALARIHPDRRLALKSPAHTARIPLLLELFPEARFVHIVRDPYAVFQSSRHIIATLFPYMHLQTPDPNEVDEDILDRYAALNDAYLRHRGAIPPGRLHEMRYEDLEKDPLGELEKMYRGLGLEGWDSARPRFAEYLASLRTYRKNAFPALQPREKALVQSRWERFFAAFDYPM